MDGDYEKLVYFSTRPSYGSAGNRAAAPASVPQQQCVQPAESTRALAEAGVLVQRRDGHTAHELQHHQLLPRPGRALLSDGLRIVVDNMWLNGSGDAFWTYGTAYARDTTLYGDGDTILGYGSVFWSNCVINSGSTASWTPPSRASTGTSS